MRDEVVGPAGPTTATRMDKFTRMMLEKTGLISMIGKSERSPVAIEAIKDNQSAYLMAVGGAAYLVSKAIEAKVVGFADLGMEAIYEFTVQDMPVTVAVDAKGTSVHNTGPQEAGEDRQDPGRRRLSALDARLPPSASRSAHRGAGARVEDAGRGSGPAPAATPRAATSSPPRPESPPPASAARSHQPCATSQPSCSKRLPCSTSSTPSAITSRRKASASPMIAFRMAGPRRPPPSRTNSWSILRRAADSRLR